MARQASHAMQGSSANGRLATDLRTRKRNPKEIPWKCWKHANAENGLPVVASLLLGGEWCLDLAEDCNEDEGSCNTHLGDVPCDGSGSSCCTMARPIHVEKCSGVTIIVRFHDGVQDCSNGLKGSRPRMLCCRARATCDGAWLDGGLPARLVAVR